MLCCKMMSWLLRMAAATTTRDHIHLHLLLLDKLELSGTGVRCTNSASNVVVMMRVLVISAELDR